MAVVTALVAFLAAGCGAPCDDRADCPSMLSYSGTNLTVLCGDVREGVRVRQTDRRVEVWRAGDGGREHVALLDLDVDVPAGSTLVGFAGAAGECRHTNGSGVAFDTSLSRTDAETLIQQAASP